MINIVIIVVLACLIITELLFVIRYSKLNERIESINLDYKYFKSIYEIHDELIKNLVKEIRLIEEKDNAGNKLITAISEQHDRIFEQYKTLMAAYDRMNSTMLELGNEYGHMYEAYQTILNAWERMEERYSDSYEQYKKCVNDISDLKRHITERAHDIISAIPESYETNLDINEDSTNQIEFDDLNAYIKVGDILDEDWDLLKEEYREEILNAGSVDADRLGEMILDSTNGH